MLLLTLFLEFSLLLEMLHTLCISCKHVFATCVLQPEAEVNGGFLLTWFEGPAQVKDTTRLFFEGGEIFGEGGTKMYS